MTPVPTL